MSGLILGTLAALPEIAPPIFAVHFTAEGPNESEVASQLAFLTENASSQRAISHRAKLPAPLEVLLVRQTGVRDVQLIVRGTLESAEGFAKQASVEANPQPPAKPAPPARPVAAPAADDRIATLNAHLENLRPRSKSDPAARALVFLLERELQGAQKATPPPPPPAVVVEPPPPQTAVIVNVRPAPFWNLLTIAQFSIAGVLTALALLLVIRTFRFFTASEVS